jgi:hypothetical protein
MLIHASVPAALKHPATWAGIAGALITTAENLEGHLKTALLSGSGVCSVVAIILKSPDANPEPPKDPNA